MSQVLRRLTDTRRSSSQNQASCPGRPIKRALIIGIKYVENTTGIQKLRAAHDDAIAWKKLLEDTYGFKSSKVTLMLDAEGTEAELQPTQSNIRTQIAELVKGAQSKDQFVFYYSGHSGQRENGDTDEDDGRDEYIIPMDDDASLPDVHPERKIILDDELRKILVDSLPVGSTLTAVFDSCHSGTLLDLDHYLCNNVWFPFMSRGPRSPLTLRARVRRRDGHDMRNYGVRVLEKTKRRAATDGDRAHGLGRRTDVKIHQWRRIAEEKMESFETALGRIPAVEGQKGANQFVEVFRRRCVYRTPSAPLPPKEPVGRYQSFNSVVSSLRGFVWGSPLQRCTSPEPMTKCSGECPARPKNEAPTMPNAFSVAACHDPETVWEVCKKDGDRQTMTRCLIEILEKDPHPQYLELAKKLGHQLRERITNVVEEKCKKNKEKQKLGKTAPVYDVDASVPQIGAMKRVTSSDRFMK